MRFPAKFPKLLEQLLVGVVEALWRVQLGVNEPKKVEVYLSANVDKNKARNGPRASARLLKMPTSFNRSFSP